MKLENWALTPTDRNPYLAPELQSMVLIGEVYGHPRFEEGHHISTSTIVGKRGEVILTRSGSEYELGEPHPDYEAAFPNAKQRALSSIPSSKERI